ncbi:hypothetical protein [Acidithiobacillus sp.]|uniref:hypothetical protein n=1 Tax=Acidithiobacillus sp. TaxID=1872118 RepID=UPI00262024A6|nr:hypothetical protein [Acidithiobacillus sp.]MDD2748784.1 hypothetical protein [Acidithiobacillus sp.]MDD5280313.1 hypothetical protein [Acidithiobacillus sp.]
MNLAKIKKIMHICIDSFSEISILSIPVLIYLFFIVIRIYSGNFTEIALEMSLMSIIYYSDSVLIAKRINHNTWNVAINVVLIVLIIFASSLFTLELLANGTKTAALVFQKKSGAYIDMQIANIMLIVGGFIANLILRIIVRIQGNVVGE